MIIHAPELRNENGEFALSAAIETRSSRANIPKQVWFRAPEEYAGWMSDRLEPFVAGLTYLAMYLGEDLEVRGPLSPHLAFGLRQYQNILHKWEPKLLRIAEIKPARYESAPPLPGRVVANAFSGGVDSFFSLWSYMPQNEPLVDYQVSHAVFFQGADIRSFNKTLYPDLFRIYNGALQPLGITLLGGATNLTDFEIFMNGAHYGMAGRVFALAHIYSGLVRRFYVPSTVTHDHPHPYGSHAVLDHLLSSEAVEIIHQGSAYTRAEKLSAIASWELPQKYLRTCWYSIGASAGIMNDGTCEKCLRSMTQLEALGLRSQFATLPDTLTRRRVRTVLIQGANRRREYADILRLARANGKRALAWDLRYALLRSRILMPLISLAPKQLRRRLYWARHRPGRRSSPENSGGEIFP